MIEGARTPEELEQLLEDAYVVRDERVGWLFEKEAVVFSFRSPTTGAPQVVTSATSLWEQHPGYVADPRWILQAPKTALILSSRSINVVHKDPLGWRFAICCLGVGVPAAGTSAGRTGSS